MSREDAPGAKPEMTPERWRQVKDLLAAAIRLPAQDRPAFIDQACHTDTSLRQELQSLLSAHEQAEDGRLESPAWSMSGQAIGQYQLLEKIGEGGMGVVYRARDNKLGRHVAIKILPPLYTANQERLARFEREARLLAALNHPNIAAIYGLEEADGANALVLELVQGETLADRVHKGAIPVVEAVGFARQVADALEYAHEHGIIHRDLKPANIKLTPEGAVKVLDFGLAKATMQSSSAAAPSPTMSSVGTVTGAILGTAAYMSPEQARGKPVDKRADIWALGCVLYEMMTAERAFAGETTSDVLAAILGHEPDWKALPAATPPSLRRVLSRCLEKDPKRRLRDAGDARLELEAVLSEPAAPEGGPRLITRRSAITALAGAAAGTVASSAFFVSRWHEGIPRKLTRFALAMPEAHFLRAGWASVLSFAPDSRRLAFLAWTKPDTPPDFYLRSLGDLEPRLIKDVWSGGSFFSPDSAWLGYFCASPPSMRKMPLQGGAPVTVFPRKAAAGNAGASWASDGTIYFVTEIPGGLMSVPATGGQPKQLLPVDSAHGERILKFPCALPGADTVLYTVATADAESFDDAHIAAYSTRTGKTKVLIEGGTHPRYSPSGHLVYARNGNLLAVRFDPDRLQVRGQPVTVLEGVLMSRNTGPANFDISASGDLAYAPGICEGGARTLYWVDRGGHAEKLPLPARSYLHPRISPDARKLAIEIEGSNHDCYIYDFTTGVLSNITADGWSHWPLWSPDGRMLAYRSGPMMQMRLWQVPADRSRAPQQVPGEGYNQNAESYSPDGNALAYTAVDPGSPTRVVVASLAGDRKPLPLDNSKYSEGSPKFSPDGRWLAYCSNESGKPQVYVQAFPGPGAKTQISNDGGTDPVWRRTGGELFYRNGDSVMAVPVSTASGFSAGRPRELWKGHYSHGMSTSCGPPGLTSSNYDVTGDGQRFLMIKDDDQDSATSKQIVVALGWSDELTRLAR